MNADDDTGMCCATHCTLESTRASQSVGQRNSPQRGEIGRETRNRKEDAPRSADDDYTLRTCSRNTVAFLANQDRRPANISALGRGGFVCGRLCTRDCCTGASNH